MNSHEQQRRSFAYGNTAIENPRITRAMVDQEADRMDREQVKTFFIEKQYSSTWSRYAGPFDDEVRAEAYMKALCGPGYRIARYERISAGG